MTSNPKSPLARSHALLVALATGNATWSVFLWRELVAARAGAETFCAFGGDGSCTALWDAGFASAVHRLTAVPVAGWGLIWSVVAFALPLFALLVRAEQRGDEMLRGAIDLTALGGLVGVVALLAASASAGAFCSSCAVTYALTGLYAAVAFRARRVAPAAPSRSGAGIVAAGLVAAYLLALYPGLRTPHSTAEEGQRALAQAAAPQARPAITPPPTTASRDRALAPGADQALRRFLDDLAPSLRQALADSLAIYAASSQLPQGTPRALDGPATALRITEFTDILCSHCAALHETLAYLRTLVLPDAFAVDSRHFPLDGNCNPHLPTEGPESVRCVGAKTLICLEGSDRADELAGVLYRHQEGLTTDRLFELTAPFVEPATLMRCIAEPQTQLALQDDTDLAWQYRPDGTPLVLVNGRRGTSFGPFLYAMILTGGDPTHPAFSTLPPANPNAHIH